MANRQFLLQALLVLGFVALTTNVQWVVGDELNEAAAISLKEQIENSLRAYNTDDESEDDDTVVEDDTADSFIQTTITAEVQNETLLQLQAEQKMSVNCWQMDENSCESEYCLWKDGECRNSPAAFEILCSFYCESKICTQLPPQSPPDAKCPVRPSATTGLCAAIQSQTNCQIQHGLCKWKQGRCEDVASCCSAGTRYCKTKKKAVLNKAVKLCAGFANAKTMCTFASTQC